MPGFNVLDVIAGLYPLMDQQVLVMLPDLKRIHAPEPLKGLGNGWYYTDDTAWQLAILEDGSWVLGKPGTNGTWHRVVHRSAGKFLENGQPTDKKPSNELGLELMLGQFYNLLQSLGSKYAKARQPK